MKLKTKKTIFATLIFIFLFLPSFFARAFQLVPCQGTAADPCTFNDLVFLVVRLINYLLAASAVVTAYFIILASFNMITALGNPEKLTGAKESLSKAVIGFALILMSFAFVNLVLYILGITNCSWWSDPAQLFSGRSCLIR